MKKLLKKLSLMRLEERVLFDAAAAAAAMEADQQNQQNEELQQQQQQLQEQLAEEAARQQAQAEAQEAQEAAAEAQEDADGTDVAAAENQEGVSAGSEVSAAIEAIASDDGIEVESEDSVLDVNSDDVVGENLEGLNGVEADTEAAENALLTTEDIAAAIADGSRHELVIVSGTVQDSKVIIDGLAEGTEVLVLENDSDVLDQINEYLDKSAVKYDAIHVISHGGDGYMVLNNSVIDMESLEADPASWAAIGEHVAKDGDILLYGCNIAQTENGKAFASQLASLTGADIAASVDVTGGSYGWELEYVTNAIATPVLSFNGYDARLASLTVVVDGSGNYDTEVYVNSDTTRYVVENGALVKQTWASAGEGQPFTHDASKDEIVGGKLSWAITQANATEGRDTIVIQVEGNLGNGGAITEGVSVTLGKDNTASFGNITLADATDGSVTISGGSVTTGTISASGLGTSVSISDASSVSTGAVTLGMGNSFSVSNVTAESGNVVSTGAITLGEGASASFFNISTEGNGTALNISGAINGNGNEGTSVTFSNISSKSGKAVNVTGAINAETVSFNNISTETGSYAIDLAGLTAKNVSLSGVEGNIDFGGLTVNEGRFTASATALQVSFGNVSVNEASFTFTGAVDNLSFGSVAVNSGSFNVTNALAAEENIAADVTFTGAVTVTDSSFSVAVSGNPDYTGDVKPEGSVTFNSTFTASAAKGSTSVSITVTDLGEGPEYTQDDRILGNTAGTTESRIIFNGDVTLGGEGSKSSVSADLSAVYIGFNGNVAVGAGKGATTLTVSDFGQVKFAANKTFYIGESGPDASNNDTVTFTAIDRDGFNEEHKVGYFGDKYRVEVGNLDIGRGAELVINNLMMDVRGTTVSHYGDITGKGSELTFRNTVTTLSGVGFLGGEVHLDSVRYENGLTSVDAGSIYWGEYGNLGLYLAANGNNAGSYTIAVNLFELVGIDNITFINRNDDTANFTGSYANVEMSGRFAEHKDVTFDFEVGSKVNVIYNSSSQQYVLAGNYYELTVTNTAEKILTGAISVGVSAEKLAEVKERYSTAYVTPTAMQILGGNYPAQPTDIKILARKMEHLYRGGMSLGTTLKTQGHTVDFWGYTYSVTDKAMIDATSDNVSESNRVSYHVAHNFVNLNQDIQGIVNLWDLLFRNQNVAHENGGVGPNNATGTARNNEDYKAFFGGTYQYLTIDTMSSLPAMAGLEILGQDTVTFNVDVDATINGAFVVTSLNEGDKTSHHHLTVNVDSTMTFNNSGLKVDDATVHFNGAVLGNLEGISATRDTTFGNSGEMEVTFAGNLANIGMIQTDGIALTFGGDVQRIYSIDVYGTLGNVNYAKITFNGSVEVLSKITTHTEYDAAKPILTFNGKTSGIATVDSYRSDFIFNYDGDQTIWGGTYDDIEIGGTGEKTLIGDVAVTGIFNGNESSITIAAGKTLEFSTLYENSAADPHSPHFTVMEGAKFHFGAANTTGTDLYGTITSYGEVEFFGRVNYYGTITLESAGSLGISNAAQGSYFQEVINRSHVLEIDQKITIAELHNYGTMTITNNDVALNVYNHNGGNLVFDLKYGTAVNGAYSYTFDRGETGAFGTGHNRLVNGGTITVNNGTLNLNNFTQGDKDAETGKWTYGGEEFVIGKMGTLVLGATVAQVNTGNVPYADMGNDYYLGNGITRGDFLGNISNSGTFKIAGSAGVVTFVGTIENAANSQFTVSNTKNIFHGEVIHNGSLITTAATELSFGNRVSGNGTIGGTTGYNGKVSYIGYKEQTAFDQQILSGIYNGEVNLAGFSDTLSVDGFGMKTVAGDVVFNGTVNNNAVISGTNGSVVFNGNTTAGNGSFEGTLDVTYSSNASVVYGGSYGDLVINSTVRTIAVDIEADNLTLTGNNTFNGASAEKTADLIVSGDIVLGDGSQTAFGEYATINAGSEAEAVFKGGRNGATLTISTADIGDNVSVDTNGLSAAVTYNYNGEKVQRILAGDYLNNVTLSGSDKISIGDTAIRNGAFVSTASSLIIGGYTVGTGEEAVEVILPSTFEVIGTIQVDAIEVKQGSVLNLNINGASRLGTTADFVTTDAEGNVTASSTGVIMGGTLNLESSVIPEATLTVYGWQDAGSAGAINVYSGNLVFADAAAYGSIGAILSNYTMSSDHVTDTAERLQNWWITISTDVKTSDLKFYDADSKFRVINGATLTVDYFSYPDLANSLNNGTVEAFRLEGEGTQLIFAMTSQFANGTAITVNNLVVQDGSSVEVKEGYSVTIGNSADLYGEGAVQGAGNVSFAANGTYTGTGTLNMTAGSVVYGASTNVYGGIYNDLSLGNNATLSAVDVTVNNEATLVGRINMTDEAALTFAGTTVGADGTDRINAEKGTLVTYGENAEVYAGTYGNLTVQGEADRTLLGNITVDGTSTFDSLNLAGSGNWIFNGEVFGNENGTTVNNTGSVTYNASGVIFGGSYNTLILDEGNTVSADLTAENVQLSDGLTVTEGVTVTFNQTTDANAVGNDGYILAETGANVVYNNSSADTAVSGVYSGIYDNLTVNGIRHTFENRYVADLGDAQGITVNGAAVFNSMVLGDPINAVILGDAKVTFNGTTSGDVTFGDAASDKSYLGAVSYSAASETIFGGQYNNLTIAGEADDIHNVNASLTVNVINGGQFSLGGVLNLMDNVKLTINGSTDARAEGNTGSINGASSSTVTYGYNADIYGGTYGNLITNGTEYVLVNDITVNGLAHLSGTFLGDVDVTFKDQTSGNASFGVIGDASKVFGGTVTYKATVDNIFGGYYNNLIVQGKGAHTIVNDLAVHNQAVLSGTIFGTGDVIFDEGATLEGNAVFGKEGTDYQGTVTYSGDSYIYDGYYTGMNFVNNNTITHNITASGDVTVNGVLTLAEGVNVTFSGTADGNSNRGTVQAEGATLNYINTGSIYGGTYGNLNISEGQYTLLTNNPITVNGNANIEGTILGKTKVFFNGNTEGTGTFGDIAADRTYIGAVSYGVAAATIYGGQYNNISIAGGANDTHTVTSSLKVNVPEGGKFRLGSKLVLEEGVELTLNGLTDANEEGNTGRIEGHKDSSVVYELDADVYGGTYGNLVITGGAHDLINSFTVENAAVVSGSITGNADITFKGAVSGDALFGSLVNGVSYNGIVTFDGSNGDTQTVFRGYYDTLNIVGDHLFENELRVASAASFTDGVMTGDATVTFDQGAVLSGNGTFGVDADNRYQGDVIYNGVVAPSLTRTAAEGGMFGGFYTNLILDNNNTTSAVIDALNVKLSDALIITHNGAFTFAGTTDANESGNDGYVEAGIGTSVIYADTAALYGGTYGDLAFGSDRVLVFDMTVNGLATINGTMTGTADVTFNAGIAGDAKFGTETDPYAGTITFAGADSGVYGGFYKDLILTGNHLLENAIVVVEGGNASVNGGVLSGEASVTFNGNTSGNSVFGASEDAPYTGKVTYSPNAAVVYGGFYSDLVINGDHVLTADFTVVNGGAAYLSGNMTGTANIAFKGATSGDAVFGTEDVAYAGNVGFGAEAQTVYSGHYTNLAIENDHTLDGTFVVEGLAYITGVQTLADNTELTFNGTTNAALPGAGTLVDDSTVAYSTVTYGADAAVFGGSYGNLIITGGTHIANSDFAVAGDMDFEGLLTGTANVTIMDTVVTTGNGVFGTAEQAFGGAVTYYKGDDVALYDGFYKELILEGSFSIADRTITVTDRAEFNGTQSLAGNTALTLSGKNEGADAAIASENTASVTYNGAADQNVYTGTYGNLTIEGDHLLANNFVVNALATVNGVMSGSADVTFNGDTAGTGTFGASEAAPYTGKVTYEAAADVIYGGFYNDLAINGDHVLEADFTVVKGGNAALSGNMTGSADIAFKGATSGDAVFGTEEIAYAGSVAFGAEAQVVYNGHYTGLAIEEDHTLDGTFVVEGLAAITGVQTLADGTILTFNGTTNAAQEGAGALIDASAAIYSTVTYGADADVFGGEYGDLIIRGAHVLGNDFTVAGIADIDGVMTGSANVTFYEGSETRGNGAFGTADDVYGGVVTYASGINPFSGVYSELILDGARVIADRTVTVTTKTVVNGTQELTGSTVLTLTGANEGTDAAIASDASATVIYNGAADQNVYTGTYGNLTIEGDHILANNFTVTTSAVLSGVQTVTDDVEIILSGANSGDATFAAAPTSSILYNGAADQGVYGGTYGNLGISGDHLLENAFTVEGIAALTGTMTGSADVTFNGTNTGNAAFGTVRSRYTGAVTFNGNSVYAGYYGGTQESAGLILTDGATIAEGVNVDAASVALTGTLTVAGSINFSGYTDAAAKKENARVESTGSVIYGPDADIYGGDYSNLSIYGDHYFAADLTVNGITTIYDNADGSDAKLTGDKNADLVFNGAVTGNGALFAKGSNNKTWGSVTYNSAEGEVLGGAYNDLTVSVERTLNNSFSVDGDAVFTGTQTIGNGTTLEFSGTTNADDEVAAVVFNGPGATVVYSGSADVYNGVYGTLVLNGAHTLNDKTVSVRSAAEFNGTQYLTGNTVLTLSGTNTGNGAKISSDNTASVIYNGGAAQGVFSGTYGNLAIEGSHTLDNSFTVNGAAVLTGTMTGAADVTFTGATSGEASFGTSTADYEGKVTYSNSGRTSVDEANVYGGWYSNLKISGAHTLGSSFSVSGDAAISGTQNLDGAVINFNGTTSGNGKLVDAGTSFSKVVYSATADVFGGSYGNLTISGDHVLNNDFSAAGSVVIDGIMTGTADVTFLENAKTSGAGTFGSEAGVYEGSVKYDGNVKLYDGFYKELILEGNHSLYNNTISVTEKLNVISGVQSLSGSTVLTLSGVNTGNGTFNGSLGTTVIYNGSYDQGVISGTYGNLTITGSHSINKSITAKGEIALTGNQTVARGVTVDFAGTFTDEKILITGESGSTVIYRASAAVLGGDYSNLTIDGAHVLANDFTVSGISDLNAAMTGTANVTYKSGAETRGYGSFGTSVTAPYTGVVSYASGVNPHSGFYATLELNGDRTISNRDITVVTSAVINGTQRLTNGSVLTLTGTNTGAGSIDGALGTTVIYNGVAAQGVYGGTYGNLTIVDAHTLSNSFMVDGVATLTGVQTVGSNVSITFNGSNLTDANKAATLMVTSSNSYVIYNDSTTSASRQGKIYGGTYTNLTVNGYYVSDAVTLNGDVTGRGQITFDGAVGGTGAFNSTQLSAVYNQGGNILKGTYDNLSVKGTGTITGTTRVTGDLIALATSGTGDALSAGSTSYAVIAGSGKLQVEGALVNFDGSDTVSKGRFNHTGEVILAGTSYNIVGGPSGNAFSTLTVKDGVSLNLGLSTVSTFDTGANSTSRVAGVQFSTIKGEGNIYIYQNVTGSSISMEGGTVTYTADAPTTLIYGTYYNLTLQQSEGLATPEITIGGTVNVARHFNIGGHDLQVSSAGKLTMFTFDGEGKLKNSGTVTFGSQNEEAGSPGTRQVWDGGAITNEGSIIVNRNNYTFDSVHNEGDAKATFTVTEKAGFGSSTAIELNYFRNEFGATAVLNGTTRIMEMADGGWTNEGTLSIKGFENFGFADGTLLDITIANRAALNIANGGDYFFDDTTNVLHLGGTINAETGTTIAFLGVDEVVGTKTYSTTGEGTMIFAFTSPITQGLYGNLNNHGTMIFATEGQKYLGNVTNGSASGKTDGYLYVLADSVFKGSVNSEYGLVSVGYMGDTYYLDVDATFVHTVHSGSAFLIAAGSHATFENTVTAAHDFTIEGTAEAVDANGAVITLNGGTALFKGDVEVYADSENDADTIFHVQEGSSALFLGDLTNRNGGTAWHSVLMIDGSVTVNGTLTNTASSSLVNVANVIVNSDNNTFGAITNSGAGAKFELNSDNNQFNGTTTNSGQLYLNGFNRFNTIKNTSPGYLWINEGATGSTFVGNITNSGTVTIVSDDPGVIEIGLVFDGAITNSGIFNVNTQGSTFNGGVTNSGTVNLYAASVFDGLVTNSGTFNVSADGAFFNEIINSGTFAVKVQDVAFHGRFTNSGTLDLNGTLKTPGISVDDRSEYFYFYEMTNSGTVNLHTAYQTVIKNLKQEGGTIFIDKDSTLHLSVVQDDADSKIQVDGDRNGVYDDHLTADKSDTFHGLYFENVPGLESPQEINAAIVYKGDVIEDAVWFNEDYTYLVGEEATWIVVNTEMVLDDFNEKGKYRVVSGGKLIVNGTASGSRFQVKGDGELIFDNTREMVINGMVQVKDADASVTFQGEGELEFNRTVYNNGSATFKSEEVSFNAGFVNTGVVTAYADVNGTVVNDGTYIIASDGLTIGGEGTQLINNGLLDVAEDARLEAVVNGTVSVREGATLSAGVTEIAGDLRNEGTVKVDNEHNYLAVTGDVLKADGTYTSEEAATLVFSGSVEKGTSAAFDNITNVVYNATASEVPGEDGKLLGTYAEGQNIILGTYDNLTLEGSFKVVDDGAVTVDGTITNTNEVKVAGDAALTLNGAVAGDGIYTNEGLLSFSETAAGAAATINNSGRTDINGAVDVDTLANSGTVNINADGIVVNGSNSGESVNDGTINVNGDNTVLNVVNREDGSITVNGDDAKLGGWNLGDVTVNGSAATTMQDAAGASYTVAEGGSLSLGDNGGTYNAAISNNGTVSIDASVSSFAGGITNNGVVEVNESENLDLASLLAGNANGQITLNDKISLQDLTVVGGIQVNYGLSGDDLSGTKVAENATLTINADSTVNQSVEENKGTVKIADGVTFTVDAADAAFDGTYEINGSLVTTGNADFNGTVNNTGSIAVGGDADFSGAVNNTGSMDVAGYADFSGAVNNTGSIASSNASFSGALVNNGTISVDNMVIFSGETSGSGRVESDIAIYDGDATGIFAGDYGTLVVYNGATMLGDAETDQLYLYGSIETHEDGTLTVNGELFNGEYLTGTGNGSWVAFSPGGAVGDMYPHITNPNFHAIAPYLNALSLEWGNTGRFEVFRRLPAEQRPIAVGDMMDPVVLNNYEQYDLIDFDSEFFGNSDAIGILDDESREVLEDALTVEASDLKALLED